MTFNDDPNQGQQPDQYGQQPGQYGQQPGQYDQQPGQYGQQPGQYGQPPMQYGAPGAAMAAPVDTTKATIAAAGGGIGLALTVIGFCCSPLAVIGLAGNLTGLIMGVLELKAIDRGESDHSNRTLAMAGAVMGGIGLAVFVLVIVFFLLAIGASSFSNLE